MIKILQIVPSINSCGGVENYIMNYYRHVDKSRVQFDFAYHNDGEVNFKEEIKSLGGKIFKLDSFSIKKYRKIKEQIRDIFENNKYDIVHCHMANAAFLYFKLAKKYGIKVRVLHSHQSAAADKFSHAIRNYPLLFWGKKMATHYVACSKLAGDFLFKKKYVIINNAIDSSKFEFKQIVRMDMRKKYCIDEDVQVVGNIGRFCSQKNQLFLLDIFKKLLAKEKRAKLVLVGAGELRDKIVEKIKNENMEKDVIIIDPVVDTSPFYNMFDLFCLPSLYEGLPVVGVEAQYNGLKIITSDKVTKELDFTKNVKFLPLKDENVWVNEMVCKKERIKIICDDYDIRKQAETLTEYYESLI